jgi:hypothetical protein
MHLHQDVRMWAKGRVLHEGIACTAWSLFEFHAIACIKTGDMLMSSPALLDRERHRACIRIDLCPRDWEIAQTPSATHTNDVVCVSL